MESFATITTVAKLSILDVCGSPATPLHALLKMSSTEFCQSSLLIQPDLIKIFQIFSILPLTTHTEIQTTLEEVHVYFFETSPFSFWHLSISQKRSKLHKLLHNSAKYSLVKPLFIFWKIFVEFCYSERIKKQTIPSLSIYETEIAIPSLSSSSPIASAGNKHYLWSFARFSIICTI